MTVQDPDNPDDPSARMYAATRTVTETVVTPSGTQVRLDGSDVDRPLGVKAALGYDIWSAGRFSLGLDLTFAAYWNMRSAAFGSAGGGRIDVRRTTEYYLFGSGPIPDDTDFTSFQPDAEPYRRDTVDLAPTELAGRRLHARIRSDLYQVGLGPRATWRVCDGLDAYGRVEALCNLAHLDFDTGASRTGETKCMPGVGGTVGLAAALAEGVSLYAEAGYEWIDAAETKLGRAQAEVDFSGLVLGGSSCAQPLRGVAGRGRVFLSTETFSRFRNIWYGTADGGRAILPPVMNKNRFNNLWWRNLALKAW